MQGEVTGTGGLQSNLCILADLHTHTHSKTQICWHYKALAEVQSGRMFFYMHRPEFHFSYHPFIPFNAHACSIIISCCHRIGLFIEISAVFIRQAHLANVSLSLPSVCCMLLLWAPLRSFISHHSKQRLFVLLLLLKSDALRLQKRPHGVTLRHSKEAF